LQQPSPTQSTEEAIRAAEDAMPHIHPEEISDLVVAVTPILLKQGAEEAERERDKWAGAVVAGIGFTIAVAAQKLLMTVHPADGKSDPVTVSRASVTALQSALRDAEPEQGTPIDAARRRGAEEERERLKEFVDRAQANADWHATRDEGEDAAMWRNYASALRVALDNQEAS
jgi:hypothetical protein